MKVFKVLKPGFFTTVQDLGRYGYLKFGVPLSGAMDAFSHVAANLLVENNPDDACLEITLIGPELLALVNTYIAVTGGDISIKINGGSAAMWKTLEVKEGDMISFGKIESGCRAYIAIAGGIETPLILGSRSTYVRGGFGGLNGRQLREGDMIEGSKAPSRMIAYKMPEELIPDFPQHIDARVIMGPQAEMFTEKGIETFLSSQYEVTPEADRMGYRLEGPIIEHKFMSNIVSDALLPGAVQVPKSGKPIVIMRDAPTTGGYPKIATVITPDVSKLGQAKPHDTVEFTKITVREAHDILREHNRLLNRLGGMLIRGV
jgi:biotin-dependent carboxylase-like uncharacterized protein